MLLSGAIFKLKIYRNASNPTRASPRTQLG